MADLSEKTEFLCHFDRKLRYIKGRDYFTLYEKILKWHSSN